MCGIVGIATGLAPESAVHSALARLAARGPDGVGLVQAGGFWLGVRRLAITDPAAAQPLRAADGTAWIAFNGSVTDPDRLRRELLAAGATLGTRNDAELALALAATQGAEGLAALRGMHALAVVDVARDRLLLARDRFGEKPLWVAWQDGRIAAFASTVAALRALLPLPGLAGDAAAEFLRFGWFRGRLCGGGFAVQALAPGAVLEQSLSPGRAPRPVSAPALDAEPLSRADAAPALRTALRESVRLKAQAEVGVGLFLSGGLDSSAVAAACALEQRPVRTFTLRCAGEGEAEADRARAVTRALALPHEVVEAGPEVLDALPALTAGLGLPLGDPSILLVFHLARVAVAAGCRVVLAGEGADELLLGYRRYALLPWLVRLRRLLPAQVRTWLARGAGSGRSTGARLRRAVATDDPYGALLEIASPSLLAELLGEPPAAVPDRAPAPVTAEDAAALDRCQYLPLDLLQKLDHGLMSAGVEGRCPYLDPGVAAVAQGLPYLAGRPGRKRWLARAFAAELPGVVRRAPKHGFALPLDRWLREHDLVQEVLCERITRERGLFRPAALDRLLTRLVRHGEPGLGLPLFVACALELHLRSVDKEPHA